MAEAFLNLLAGDRFEAESAGLEPGSLNPLAVEVMKETGIDISGNRTKGVTEFIDAGKLFQYVITVCDDTGGDKCPVFPGYAERLHWNIADPSALEGTYDDRIKRTREIRDQIKAMISDWMQKVS